MTVVVHVLLAYRLYKLQLDDDGYQIAGADEAVSDGRLRCPECQTENDATVGTA